MENRIGSLVSNGHFLKDDKFKTHVIILNGQYSACALERYTKLFLGILGHKVIVQEKCSNQSYNADHL